MDSKLKAIIVFLLVGVLLFVLTGRYRKPVDTDRIHDNLIVLWSYIEDEGEYTQEEAREAYKIVEKGFDDLT